MMGENSDSQDIPFGSLFPKNIFGEIPKSVAKFIDDSGFDRLVTLATLTVDDIVEIEKESSSKLKLGHKRLIMQMVKHANNVVESTVAAAKAEAKAGKIANIGVEPNVDVDSDKNLKEVLHQSLKNKIRKFCKSNNINLFDIISLDLVKSTDGAILYASATCICGELFKIYTNSSSNNQKSITWVLSGVQRHLTKSHTPDAGKINKITEFLATNKRTDPGKDTDEDSEIEIGDNVIDIASADDESISGECTGDMKS